VGAAAAGILSSVSFQIVDLPASLLGREVGGTLVQIDRDAAGFGWFVDRTPWDDGEFAVSRNFPELVALPGVNAARRVDLLTVVLHELGHVLGYSHQNEGLMDDALPLGTRRLPEAVNATLDEPLETRNETCDFDAGTVDAVFAESV
jgi:hypothetical protein